MGLAAPRKKTKISHDPNNTNWSRSTSGYGHKILSSQGWTPGSFLGAQNAAHADMFTAASASHIKVVVKDDTLGLGARSTRDRLDEPTGLDAFKGLLGRLNGKTDTDLAQEQRKRDDVKLARYAATKWPTVRFISGGLLAQEKTETRPAKPPQKERQHKTELDSASSGNEDKKMKDSQAFTGELDSSSGDGQATQKRSKARKKEKADPKLSDTDAAGKHDKREKKSKKRKRTEKKGDSHPVPDDQDVHRDGPTKDFSEQKPSPPPKPAAVSKERRPVGRHTFRGRHIEAKKRALLDDKSLSEIFMVKS